MTPTGSMNINGVWHTVNLSTGQVTGVAGDGGGGSYSSSQTGSMNIGGVWHKVNLSTGSVIEVAGTGSVDNNWLPSQTATVYENGDPVSTRYMETGADVPIGLPEVLMGSGISAEMVMQSIIAVMMDLSNASSRMNFSKVGMPLFEGYNDIGVIVLEYAMSKLGLPYDQNNTKIRAGTHIDCSALVQFAYAQAGIKLPRTAASQGKQAVENGWTIEGADLDVGDLVFYAIKRNGKWIKEDRYMHISHVSIYAGDGMVVEASSDKNAVVHRSIDANGKWIVFYARPH